ncbi:MAG: sodium:solute symporter family transporter [Planctomycetota bacterium]|jgi:Na+/proline symporter
MTTIVISALLLAFIVYIAVGLFLGRRTKGVADLLPLAFNRQARVKNSSEFSASTVATTISLATVVMAFFELAGSLGIWLLWSVVTTSAGLWVVRLFAKRIWKRISQYNHRPTLHEFLGREFNSEALSYVGAICTSMGFLGAFAIELTVGSMFFAGLVPAVPAWVVVIVLSVVAFVYTAVGGFRAVIVTDRIQMISIWLLLLSLPLFYISHVVTHGGWAQNFNNIPSGTLDFSYREGLIPFLLGIFVINVPTFISDMSIWQRIAGAQKNRTVVGGLWRSVFASATTWGAFAILACLAFMIIKPAGRINSLVLVLNVVGNTKGILPVCVLFLVVLGLYGAMLSTASTQLIAVSHTLYEDVFSPIRKHSLEERLESKKELNFSRTILVVAAIISTILVQLLSSAGFSIADLVFAIYGAQLGLCPLVISALLLKREQLKMLSAPAALAVTAGFVTGWGTAIYGRLTINTNLVFLAPVSSLIVSSLILCTGFLIYKTKKKHHKV